MEITAALTDTGPASARPGLLDSVIDLFNLRTVMPVRGHYWSGLRCGPGRGTTKTRLVKRKELTIDERR